MNYIIIDSGQNGFCIAAVPENIVDNIRYYQSLFDSWLIDRSSPHSYWRELENGEFGLEYDGPTAFIEWLNDNIIKGSEKARIICEEVPMIHF